MPSWRYGSALLLGVGLYTAGSIALAQAPASAEEPSSCIEVRVDGVRAPSYNCLSQQLRPAAPRAGAPSPAMVAEGIAQRPSNQLGLFNRAATSHRMGNQFGQSVFPQRPPPPVAAPPRIPQLPQAGR